MPHSYSGRRVAPLAAALLGIALAGGTDLCAVAAGLHMPRGHASLPDFGERDDGSRDALMLAGQPDTEFSLSRDAGKSYAIPALEILGFQFLLNRFDRMVFGSDYAVSESSIRRNLRGPWVTDNDPYTINQFGHPYQGSIYHGLARSAGLSYWEALGYTFAGSAVWEIAGETTLPSKNDQISTGIGGTFLGESLFRMAHLVLESGGGLSREWRELAAAAISPPVGFNRAMFGKRFAAAFDSRDPVYYSTLQLGISGTTQNAPGASTRLRRNEAIANFSMDYGLPGKPGYRYERPFDHFSFQITASSANAVESIMTRGLLLGTDYEAGERYRGVWGLYGSYDYIAPQVFRVSSTALSLGTTGQAWLTRTIALQGSVMAGAGYAAVGTLRGARENDYRYGITPQMLIALRLIMADRAALDVTAREYFVSNVAGGSRGGHDNIARADVTFTWRIHKQHAVAVKYLWSRRDATYPDLGDRTQTRATIGVFYTLLGLDRFGAVDWRQ
ncbi:MAG: DUF3943 domain-containing protein [Rhodospirillaceae bacterium]